MGKFVSTGVGPGPTPPPTPEPPTPPPTFAPTHLHPCTVEFVEESCSSGPCLCIEVQCSRQVMEAKSEIKTTWSTSRYRFNGGGAFTGANPFHCKSDFQF